MSKIEEINHHRDFSLIGRVAYQLIAVTAERKQDGYKTDDGKMNPTPSRRSLNELSQLDFQFYKNPFHDIS